MNESMMYKRAGVICNEISCVAGEDKFKIYTSNITDVENLNRTIKYEYQYNVDAQEWRMI